MPRPNAPPDLGARLTALVGRPLDGAGRIAVAVSGGPDSMALLWLAAETFPDRLLALTVDHGLRPEAAAEAAMVAAHCAAHGIAHRTLLWTGPKPAAGLPGAARDARYALMAGACVEAGVTMLLTAHHADDQAETLLMRLARGGGAGGLAGIRPVRALAPGLLLVRPLLGCRRAALRAMVTAAGWPFVDDPSNADPDRRRTQARRLLAATGWLDPRGLAQAADNLAAAEAALAWAADRAWAGAATAAADGVRLEAGDLPAEVQHRLVRRAIGSLAPAAKPRGTELARLAGRLAAGGGGTLAGVRARALGHVWHFSRAPSRRDSRGKTS